MRCFRYRWRSSAPRTRWCAGGGRSGQLGLGAEGSCGAAFGIRERGFAIVWKHSWCLDHREVDPVQWRARHDAGEVLQRIADFEANVLQSLHEVMRKVPLDSAIVSSLKSGKRECCRTASIQHNPRAQPCPEKTVRRNGVPREAESDPASGAHVVFRFA